MALADLTDPAAVETAIEEFDRLGRKAFLANYNSGAARDYFLVKGTARYDSKAIAAAAHGYQFPNRGPLDPKRFSGGSDTVARKLRALGFEVIGPNDPSPRITTVPDLDVGTDYSWNELGLLFDFGPEYLGAAGGMVSRPSQNALLLMTHPGGARSIDYGDYWDGPDLIYTGRGKTGDQVRSGQNRDLGENTKAVFVFEPSGVRRLRFIGRSTTIDEWTARQPDANEADRTVIRYRLRFDEPPPRTESSEQTPPPDSSGPSRRPRQFDAENFPSPLSPSTSNRTAEEADALREKAVAGHHQLLTVLSAWLAEGGWAEIEEIPLAIDLWARAPRDAGRVIFEAKTIREGTESARVRSAIAQLFEYRFFYGEPEDRLCLVCDRPISDRRARLLGGLGIGVLVVDRDSLRAGSAHGGELIRAAT